jgi:integrase/recombinase XerD
MDKLMLMEAWATAFLDEIERTGRLAANTQLAYASDLRRFVSYLERLLGHPAEVEDFNPLILAEYFTHELTAGQSRNTIFRRKATLKKFHRYLILQGVGRSDFQLDDLDLDRHSNSEHHRDAETVQILSTTQIQHLLDVMLSARPPRVRRDQAILTLLLELGLPVSRIVSLDLSDIDLSTKEIRPRQKGVRWVALGPAGEYLNRYLIEGRPDLNSDPAEPALFISQLGGRLSRQGIWQILEHWSKAAGFTTPASPRLLRYTAAVNLIDNNRSFEEIHLLLGHTNPLSTQAFLRRLHKTLDATAAIEPYTWEPALTGNS